MKAEKSDNPGQKLYSEANPKQRQAIWFLIAMITGGYLLFAAFFLFIIYQNNGENKAVNHTMLTLLTGITLFAWWLIKQMKYELLEYEMGDEYIIIKWPLGRARIDHFNVEGWTTRTDENAKTIFVLYTKKREYFLSEQSYFNYKELVAFIRQRFPENKQLGLLDDLKDKKIDFALDVVAFFALTALMTYFLLPKLWLFFLISLWPISMKAHQVFMKYKEVKKIQEKLKQYRRGKT